jgi:hypothetical protein
MQIWVFQEYDATLPFLTTFRSRWITLLGTAAAPVSGILRYSKPSENTNMKLEDGPFKSVYFLHGVSCSLKIFQSTFAMMLYTACAHSSETKTEEQDKSALVGSFLPLLLSTVDPSAPLSEPSAKLWRLYGHLVKAYSKRQLSFPADRLNAFSGMLKSLERFFQSPFAYGIPERNIEKGILFHPYDPKRRQGFPSWSWAGWDSEITYPGDIKGHILTPQHNRDDPNNDEEFRDQPVMPLDILAPFESRVQSLELVYRTNPRSSDQAPVLNSTEESKIQEGTVGKRQALLSFKVETIPFSRAFEDKSSRGKASRIACLSLVRDLDRVLAFPLPCGRSKSDAFLLHGIIQSNTEGSFKEHAKSFGCDSRDLELIALSTTIRGYWKAINVMLVKRIDDIYERVTIGQINADIWDRLCPAEKIILLS